MSSRKIKKKVMALLARADLSDTLAQIREMPPHDVTHSLFSAIARSEEIIRWHAVTCMGITVARLAAEDMEKARVVIRRLLWSLNDESGGIGWGAPESLAEIMTRHEGLAREYINMLTSYMGEDGEEMWQEGNFLEHEGLQRGLLWGIGRLAGKRRDLLRQQDITANLLAYLPANDAAVRGLAARSLGRLQADNAVPPLQSLVADTAALRLYEDERLKTISVGELARQALDRLNAREQRP
ncbi:MAG TPA: HEAT repeat domain-containing protein [Desulfobacteraceae bacterium]|nr:HEAT repeat domain-containing protein [Desulfobacteraceae bacterium]